MREESRVYLGFQFIFLPVSESTKTCMIGNDKVYESFGFIQRPEKQESTSN